MQPFFVARQPIYNPSLEVEGYELLFRGGQTDSANFADANQATSAVIAGSVVDIGLDRLVGDRLAFINVPRAFLDGDLPLPPIPDRVVLELLEDLEPDESVVAAVEGLKAQGFRIALDDFEFRSEYRPLLALADFVKIDVIALGIDDIAAHVAALKPLGVQLIAEKVETHEVLARCRELGFHYFQGFFFCRPELVEGRRLAPDRLPMVQLLGRLQDPEVHVDELENLIACNAALAYQLLKYLNSAHCGLRGQVSSIRQAVIMAGLNRIRGLATLLLTAMMGSGKPDELITTALIRGRMCELLGRGQRGHSADPYFTVGLLSVLDALLDRPMEQALEGLPLNIATYDALCHGSGPLGSVLSTVIDHERGYVNRADASRTTAAYLEAVAWATETRRALGHTRPTA
jgi:c-di-GMP phosphodiesterase